jgi:hypothetical protein
LSNSNNQTAMHEWLVDDGTTKMLQRATMLAVLCDIEKRGNMKM